MLETAMNNALEYFSYWLAVMFAYSIVKLILFPRIEDKGYLHTGNQKAISYLLGILISIGLSLIIWVFVKSMTSALTAFIIITLASFFAVYNLYAKDEYNNK